MRPGLPLGPGRTKTNLKAVMELMERIINDAKSLRELDAPHQTVYTRILKTLAHAQSEEEMTGALTQITALLITLQTCPPDETVGFVTGVLEQVSMRIRDEGFAVS